MKENVKHEIGCPGELVYSASDIHYRHAYVGSRPLFPRTRGQVVLPQEELLTCARCKAPLYLVLYVSAPTIASITGFIFSC